MTHEFNMGDGSAPRRGEVENLRGGNAKTILAILTPILGALGLFGGFVWQASRYPDRAEFDDAKREMRAATTAAERRMADIEKNAALTARDVAEIQKATDRIETKLDEKHRR